MSIVARLDSSLRAVFARERRLRLWSALAAAWAGAALFGLFVLALEHITGWSSSLAPLVGALAAVAAAIWVVNRQDSQSPDPRELARRIEDSYPDLEGRLLTVVQ